MTKVASGSKALRWKVAGISAAFLAAITVGVVYARVVADAEESPERAESASSAIAINGIVTKSYAPGHHVGAEERVAYKASPPFGGAHDLVWAACTGIIYETPIRSENAVHSLEHGAVWIAYNPDVLSRQDTEVLARRVQGQPYMFVSPYPGLDAPFSLQSWGHQLKLDSVGDARIDEFISALLGNPATSPEPAATCAAIPGAFDPANPPPFDPSPPGSDAVADDFQDDSHP